MPKLPGIRHLDAIHVFEKLGYRIIRQGRHVIMSNGETRLVIPRANPVDPYTMGAIARDAGLPTGKFTILAPQYLRSSAPSAVKDSKLNRRFRRYSQIPEEKDFDQLTVPRVTKASG